jgi:hypothetical protein
VDDPFDGGSEAQDMCLAEISEAVEGILRKVKNDGGDA